MLNKGSTGTIFITSLLWRGPWLEIEPGTSRTQTFKASTLPLGYRGGGPWLGIEPGTSSTQTFKASTLPLGDRGGGPWLGIEPRTSSTWSQHSTSRLSRWLVCFEVHFCWIIVNNFEKILTEFSSPKRPYT